MRRKDRLGNPRVPAFKRVRRTAEMTELSKGAIHPYKVALAKSILRRLATKK